MGRVVNILWLSTSDKWLAMVMVCKCKDIAMDIGWSDMYIQDEDIDKGGNSRGVVRGDRWRSFTKLCFIQDYWSLNTLMWKNKYPLLLIDDLIHWLKGAHYFTTLNIEWGYNNVHIWKAMSGKWHSEPIEVSLSHWSCISASPTALLSSRPWWIKSSRTSS
jgi:hypothetical protein